jgi:hypothetical protein
MSEWNRRRRELRKQRRDAGRCTECGKTTAPEGKRTCRVCRAAQKARYTGTRAERARRYHHEHREHKSQHYRNWSRGMRLRALAMYGSRCVCCEESNPAFLTFDHVNNDGAEQRRRLWGGSAGPRLYKWLVEQPVRLDIQIMCWNCNCAKQNWGTGVCPHQLGEVTYVSEYNPKGGLGNCSNLQPSSCTDL